MTEQNANPNWEEAWQLIADIRDGYPRAAADAPTDEIVDALVEAGLITGTPSVVYAGHIIERPAVLSDDIDALNSVWSTQAWRQHQAEQGEASHG